MTTDKEYENLDNFVYKVDASKESLPKRYGDTLHIDGQKYQVIKTIDTNDPQNSHGYDANGFQGMAVAPVSEGDKVDYTHITVAYAGTNFNDNKDIGQDIQGVGGGNHKTLRVLDEDGNKNVISSQFSSARQFYRQVQTKYPESTIDTTGHSLGGALALSVASHYHLSATVFSAPDPWKAMTTKERLWSLAHPDQLTNYRHHGDLWSETDSKTLDIDGFTGTTIWCETTAKGLLKKHDTHMLSTFIFNKKGRIKALKAQMKDDVQLLDEKQKAISSLVKSLKKSGDAFTHAEKIAVDAVEAIALADSLSKIALDGIGKIIKQYQDGIDTFEPLWQQTIQSATLLGAHLTQDEVLQALADGGVTYQSVVDEPIKRMATRISQAQTVGQEYLVLATNIKTVVEKMITTDQELAGMFS